jgi:hypothetical protein
VLTLVMVPTLYSVFEDSRSSRAAIPRQRWAEPKAAVSRVGPAA